MPERDSSHGRLFQLRGGDPSLDFVNTVAWRLTDHPLDYLESWEDLLAWGRQAGLLASGDHGRVSERRRPDPMAMQVTLVQAHALRETIHRVVTAAADGATPDGNDLSALNRAVSETLSRLRLIHVHGNHYEWDWDEGTEAEHLLWSVTRSAADLMVSSNLDRVKICAGSGCGWMFLDTTRNQSRRWCDSRDCGNRERVRKHLARKRSARSAS